MTHGHSLPSARFGWTILHVPDVPAAIACYERAFGMRRRFVAPGGEYGELETGATALAFASHSLVDRIGAHGPTGRDPAGGFELALVFEPADVAHAYERAVAAGCDAVRPLATMPWGQTVGYVRDPNGFLIEICTPTTPP